MRNKLVPLLLLSCTGVMAETTISQPVTQIQYDAGGKHFWVLGSNKWGAASCPNATYIRVPSDVPGQKELLAIVLTAKANGQRLQFSGACHSSDYFNGTYVFVD